MDGIPVALMEAMACGIPVVATDVSGIPELVRNAETGLLVPTGEPRMLAAALRVLLDDEPFRRRLADAARTLVEREFSLAVEAAKLATLFAESLAGRRGATCEAVS
jgi:glycosyltransferase involved in cell wall biosynthesis